MADLRGALHRVDVRGAHGGVSIFCRALASADDRAGVAHAAARRSGLAGDEADHGFPHVRFDEFRSAFFGIAADFADHHDGVRIGIVVEEADRVKERCADDGIASNADAGGLADTETRELVHRFVGQRAAAAHQPDVALLVNASGHDADLAFARRDDAGTIWADQARLRVAHGRGDAHHVERGNAFGDANDQRERGISGFENGVGGKCRRHKNDRSIRGGFTHGVGKGVEHGPVEMLRAAFARGYAADYVRAVLDHLLRVKGAFAARKALHNEPRFFTHQNAHRAPPSATTFSAPSFMPSAMPKFSPESRKIFFPASTLVPSMRTTTGIFNCKSFAAATTPVASTSQRRMPPKMLMNTARTLESLIRIWKAFFTCSAEAPPPTSRKFAGAPPESLMISMVAMARPAPFTIQPTLPSSLM